MKEKAKQLLLEKGTLALKVIPRARTEGMERLETGADGRPLLKVKVRAVAEDGKANEAVLALLAGELGLPRRHLEITRGFTSRNKVVAYRPS